MSITLLKKINLTGAGNYANCCIVSVSVLNNERGLTMADLIYTVEVFDFVLGDLIATVDIIANCAETAQIIAAKKVGKERGQFINWSGFPTRVIATRPRPVAVDTQPVEMEQPRFNHPYCPDCRKHCQTHLPVCVICGNPLIEAKTIGVIPSYGRNYLTKEKAIADFESGKDFTIADVSNPYNGKYCSIRDLSGFVVQIRFNHLSEVCFYYVS